MAQIYDIGVQAHAAGGPIATAAAIQLETAIPNFIIHEVHIRSMTDYTRSYAKYDMVPENGYFSASERTGIGQELTDKAISQATQRMIVK